jgi:uncharacterized protein (UPF0264 family)
LTTWQLSKAGTDLMDAAKSGPIRLLVSVRSVPEAESALAGGADVIDVKEPAGGSLGRAPDAVLAAVRDLVAGRRPVSAAQGELAQSPEPCVATGLAFRKWGLAGSRGLDWSCLLQAAIRRTAAIDPACRVVPVAYADWQRAAAPHPEEVAAFVKEQHCSGWLIDTWGKDGTTLLDFLSVMEIGAIQKIAGVPLALAGSLGLEDVPLVQEIRPAWLAVRGAVCRGGRSGTIEVQRVAALVRALAQVPGG